MKDFFITILETLIGTLMGGFITIKVSKHQMCLDNNMKIADDLIENLENVLEKITSLKSAMNNYINSSVSKEKNEIIAEKEKDVIKVMNEIGTSINLLTKHYKRNQDLLEKFNSSYDYIIEEYEKLYSIFKKVIGQVEEGNLNIKRLQLKCNNINQISNYMRYNIQNLEKDLQDNYYSIIYNNRFNRFINFFREIKKRRYYNTEMSDKKIKSC